MILKELTVNNFRQFKGKQNLKFAQPGQQNVTVIHAENGFGKTALLNALHWGFWGKLTPDMPMPDNLITECVVSENDKTEIEASVEIKYNHESFDYVLRRSITHAQCIQNHAKTNLILNKIELGTPKEVGNPESIIENQIPETMGEFFFFNGENLNQLANEGKSPKLKEAIYNVLGLELLETAIEKTVSARKSLTDEFNSYADHDTQKKIDNQKQLEDEIETLKNESKQLLENRDALIEENSLINRKLEETKESQAAAQRRKDLENHLKSLQSQLAEKEKELVKFISSKAYYLFSDKLTEMGNDVIKKLEEEGKIPAKFTATDLKEILKSGRCICNADLSEGTNNHDVIKHLISQAADRSLDDATHFIKTALSTLQANAISYNEEFSTAKRSRDELLRKSQEYEDEIKQLSRKIGSVANQEIQKLEEKREDNLGRIQDYAVDVKRIDDNIKSKEPFLEGLKAQIAKAEQSNEKAKQLQKEINLSDEAISVMQDVLDVEKNHLREELNAEISKHIRNMMLKDFEADLNDDFLLRILKKTSSGKLREVARSTAEKQMTSLVFIASLIGLAKRRKEIPTILEGLWGGDLPMVMDSPYGQLGDNYRHMVATWVPTIAPQVAILVSDSQWRGEVEKGLEGKIGNEYILKYHGSKINATAKEKTTIRGISHDQFSEDQDEFTLIQEI